jgi:hypothetical protein
MTLPQLTAARPAVVLIRRYGGLIFAGESLLGALTITKMRLLWGRAPLYPMEGGLLDFLLLIVGARWHSYDARMNPDRTPAVVT